MLVPLDPSNRLKRPLKSSSRSSRSTAPSTISAPPKAAIASGKTKKEDLHRRKNPFNEMLKPRSSNDASIDGITSRNDDATQERFDSVESMQEPEGASRIAELERALAIARGEQDALRAELENIKEHGHVYRETTEDYRRQLAGSYSGSPEAASPTPDSAEMDNERGHSPYHSSRKHREDLIEQNDDLRTIARLQEQLVEQDVLYRIRLEQHLHNRDSEWNDLTARLHHTEKESQERLQQLLDLKHSISSLTRMENQVTDSELAEGMDQLHHRVREWVISNFRRAKPDFSKISRDTAKAFEAIYPDYITVSSVDRLYFYQCIIANTMMSIFHETICIGLPVTGPLATIRQLAAYIHGTGSEYSEWRRTTVRALEKSEAKHALQQEKEKLLHRMAADIERQLFELTRTNLTQTAQASLLSILHIAAELQHTLLMQKAQYSVHCFRNQGEGRVYFDEGRMESVIDVDDMDDDGDTFVARKLAFCVFPCLEKFGDEFGEKAEVRNVLLKAKVCCGVG